MKITLFIPTASVEKDQPTPWLKMRLDAAITQYNQLPLDTCSFVVAGRWNNVTESFTVNEAEVCKRYILSQLPDAHVLKEDISVETGGGFAFAKPIIASLSPDKVIIFNAKVNEERIRFFADKIFDPAWEKSFVFVDDTFSQNPRAQQKEPKALAMFSKLFEHVPNGDDRAIREILLYQTPFYFKGLINDEDFFNMYWPGGFTDFLEKRLSINNQ